MYSGQLKVHIPLLGKVSEYIIPPLSVCDGINVRRLERRFYSQTSDCLDRIFIYSALLKVYIPLLYYSYYYY